MCRGLFERGQSLSSDTISSSFLIFLTRYILFSRIIRYVTSESTMKESADTSQTPEKALVEKEKELLDKFKVSLTAVVYLEEMINK